MNIATHELVDLLQLRATAPVDTGQAEPILGQSTFALSAVTTTVQGVALNSADLSELHWRGQGLAQAALIQVKIGEEWRWVLPVAAARPLEWSHLRGVRVHAQGAAWSLPTPDAARPGSGWTLSPLLQLTHGGKELPFRLGRPGGLELDHNEEAKSGPWSAHWSSARWVCELLVRAGEIARSPLELNASDYCLLSGLRQSLLRLSPGSCAAILRQPGRWLEAAELSPGAPRVHMAEVKLAAADSLSCGFAELNEAGQSRGESLRRLLEGEEVTGELKVIGGLRLNGRLKVVREGQSLSVSFEGSGLTVWLTEDAAQLEQAAELISSGARGPLVQDRDFSSEVGYGNLPQILAGKLPSGS